MFSVLSREGLTEASTLKAIHVKMFKYRITFWRGKKGYALVNQGLENGEKNVGHFLVLFTHYTVVC